jgi:hypothetical protein
MGWREQVELWKAEGSLSQNASFEDSTVLFSPVVFRGGGRLVWLGRICVGVGCVVDWSGYCVALGSCTRHSLTVHSQFTQSTHNGFHTHTHTCSESTSEVPGRFSIKVTQWGEELHQQVSTQMKPEWRRCILRCDDEFIRGTLWNGGM